MKNPRILVVEDDVDLRSQLRQIFEDEGFRVSEAADGLEGVERAPHRYAGAIGTDCRRDEGDREALERIDVGRRSSPRG